MWPSKDKEERGELQSGVLWVGIPGFMVLILPVMGICSVSPGREGGGLPGLIGHSVSPPPAIRGHSRAVVAYILPFYPDTTQLSWGQCHQGVHLLTRRNPKKSAIPSWLEDNPYSVAVTVIAVRMESRQCGNEERVSEY